jgi:hypothetical protein
MQGIGGHKGAMGIDMLDKCFPEDTGKFSWRGQQRLRGEAIGAIVHLWDKSHSGR